MRFTCEKSMLVTGLNITGRTVAQKSALSAIEGILCKADKTLTLTGYNMETAITYEIDAEITDAGKCILCGDCVRVCNEIIKFPSVPVMLPLPFPQRALRITRSCPMFPPATPSPFPSLL